MELIPEAPKRHFITVEILSAIIMAIVAVATAWSSYQAARWSGAQSTAFASASTLRALSNSASTRAGQLSLFDVLVFNDWLNAKLAGNEKRADLDEKRFRPEFIAVFRPWLATDPLNNLDAPSGPLSMPGYRLPEQTAAEAAASQATTLFALGEQANQQADDYILTTVVLSAVLFFIALSQNFKNLRIKQVLTLLASVMLFLVLLRLLSFPIK
jgi:hypothetical protein